MVWTSDQTSALIAGQQQMMMQGQQMSQAIGAGLHMPMPSGGVQGFSNRMASGALSAAASPINLASKATGLAGMGMMGVGLTGFAGGKLGLGVTGRGLMSSFGGLGGGAVGALGSLPAFAAVGAASYAANTAISGYRETAQVGSLMAQNFSHANPQSFSGQGFAPKQIGEIARTMRSVATSSQTGMEDIMATFQSMSDMGMMQTVRSAQEFEKKFKGMIESVKKISFTFNTSMKEAAELLGSMRSSGLYTAQDVLGGTSQRQVLGTHGLSAQQVTGLERAGAGMAAGMGARRGTGARLTTSLAATVGTAAQMGVLSSADLIEATGMEGADAYAALGQSLGGAAMKFTQGAAGRASMIYAAEKKGGRFTGQIDQGRLDDILSGRVGMDAILSEAGDRTRGKTAQASFQAMSPELSGNFAQSGGNQAMMSVVQDIAQKMGPGADENDMITLVMDKIAGVDRQTASIMVKISSEWGDIRRQQGQEARQLMDARAREYERDYYHSWRGVKSRMAKGWKENVTDPIKGWGGDVGTDIESGVESMANTIYGRYKTDSLSEGQRRQMLTMSDADRQEGVRGALVGQDLDLSQFSESTRLQLHSMTGMGGSLRITDSNVDRVMEAVAAESAMGAGIGRLQDYDQSQVNAAATGMSALAYRKGIDTDDQLSASKVLEALLKSKDRTSGQDQALAMIRKATGVSQLGDKNLTNARVVLSEEQRAAALETVTAAMRGGGMEDFGGGTFRADALSELASGSVASSRSDLFNKGKGAWAERAFMNIVGVGGATLLTGGVGGAAALGAMGIGGGWGNVQAARRGAFTGLGGHEDILQGMIDDPGQREKLFKLLKGDLAPDTLDALDSYAGGREDSRFEVFGAAGSDQAAAVAAAATSIAGMSDSAAAAVRGNLTRIDTGIKSLGTVRLSSALADEGSKLLYSAKKGLKGDLKKAVVAYATARAGGNSGDVEVKAVIAALPTGDKVARREALRKIGRLRGGQALKNQLEAHLSITDLGTDASADDIRAALSGAGTSDEIIGLFDEKIDAAASGDLTQAEKEELGGYVGRAAGLDEAAGIAQQGGVRTRTMHVETAMMTKMDGLTVKMGGVVDKISEYETAHSNAMTRLDGVVSGKGWTRTPAEDE